MATTKTKPATTEKKKPGRPPGKKADKAKAAPKKAPAAGEDAAPEQVAMPLTALDLTVAKGVRAGVDEEAVERYRQRYAAKEFMPPLEGAAVKGQPDTPVFVGDGGHRGLAAKAAGMTTVPCLIHWCDTVAAAEAKAWEIAYKGNATHGLPRSSADLRAAIRSALLREKADASDRKLAGLLHCHRTPVMKVRFDMTEAGQLDGERSFWAPHRKYEESEYGQWKRGEGKRPTPKAEPEPASAPASVSPPVVAARPPEQPDPDAWRLVGLGDVELDIKVEGELAKRGIRTVGELADALEDERAADLLEKLGERACEALTAVVDRMKDPVDLDESAGVPFDLVAPPPVVTTTTTVVSPAGVRDEKGRPVPAHLLPVFEGRTLVRSLAQRVGALLKEAEQFAATPAGAAVQVNPMRQDAHNFSRGLAGAMPYVVCPACSGSGKSPKGACPQCVSPGDLTGRGWVSRLRFDQFDPALKQTADGPWDDTATPQG